MIAKQRGVEVVEGDRPIGLVNAGEMTGKKNGKKRLEREAERALEEAEGDMDVDGETAGPVGGRAPRTNRATDNLTQDVSGTLFFPLSPRSFREADPDRFLLSLSSPPPAIREVERAPQLRSASSQLQGFVLLVLARSLVEASTDPLGSMLWRSSQERRPRPTDTSASPVPGGCSLERFVLSLLFPPFFSGG